MAKKTIVAKTPKPLSKKAAAAAEKAALAAAEQKKADRKLKAAQGKVKRALCEKIETLLNALPYKPGDIAKVLVKAGVKGEIAMSGNCPIAAYILKNVEGIGRIDVAFVATTVDNGDISFQIETPPHVTEFMKRFDAGKYKSLIA